MSKPTKRSTFRTLIMIICWLSVLSFIPLGFTWFTSGCCGASSQEQQTSKTAGKLALLLPVAGLVGLLLVYSDPKYNRLTKVEWSNTAVQPIKKRSTISKSSKK